MVISEIDEEMTDYDWFAVDKDGKVGHFATGGCGTLPRVVAASSEDLRFLTDFFRFKLTPSTDATVSEIARKAASNSEWRMTFFAPPVNGEAAIAHCFQDFELMAKRGLYSFDHAHGLNCKSRMRPCPLYYRIAIPKCPLLLTALPLDIQTILKRNILEGAVFSRDDEVNVH